MKKFIAIALAVTTLFSSVAYADNIQKNKVTITVDGQPISADNFVLDGTTYVPLRTISETLGNNVQFDSNTKTVSIESDDTQSQLLMQYANKGDLIVQESYLFDALRLYAEEMSFLEDIDAYYVGYQWDVSLKDDNNRYPKLADDRMTNFSSYHTDILTKKNNLKNLCDNGKTQYKPILQIYETLDTNVINLYAATQCFISYSQTKSDTYLKTYNDKLSETFNSLLKTKVIIQNLHTEALNTYFDVE